MSITFLCQSITHLKEPPSLAFTENAHSPIRICAREIVNPTTIRRPLLVGAGCATDLQTLQHSLLIPLLSFQRQLGKLQFHDLTGLNGLSLSVSIPSVYATNGAYLFDRLLHHVSNNGDGASLAQA